jgi:UDP-apiose/xylose synthase
MCKIYAEKFGDALLPLPEIVNVSADEFYGEGYEDSDRRIPDISKAHRLLGWKPKWGLSDMLEITMRYYVSEYIKQIPTDIKSEILDQKIVYNALSRD